MHKIEIYQRIAAIRKNEELHNLLDEIIDRFGDPTKPVLRLLEVARIKNYARELGVRTIAELPKAMDIYLQPEHKLPVKAMVALDHAFGRSMRPLPKQNGYRFILNEKCKKNITNFATRLLMMAAGDEQALVTRPAEKVGK
jgi:transcription-repair coupling factor (superfamily II helicase)